MIKTIREIDSKIITQTVKELCSKANKQLPQSLTDCIKSCRAAEKNPLAKGIFSDMLENIDAACELSLPICQDTGMVIVFAEIGQDVHISGDTFPDAVNKGVAEAYTTDCLRCSIISDPLFDRKNTSDNTPAVIHTEFVKGDKIRITVAPKGFGSENMSRIKMFTPSASADDIIDFVCETVKIAGANPCPPIVAGVGIGGSFESCALLAKTALCTDIESEHPDKRYAELEKGMLKKVNALNIGAQGFGGDITALAIKIRTAPTHIAGLPVAVNIGCHVTRHAQVEI